MKKLTVWVISICLTLILVGCGGGGSASTSGSSEKGSISGLAVDGPIVGGLVTAYMLNGGIKGNAIATATTDGNGNYSLNSGSYTGPLLLEVTGGNYTDEATGKSVSIPTSVGSGFQAVVANVSAQSNLQIQITPLTTLAAARANAMHGGLIAANIDSANMLVDNQFGGIGILHTQPINPLNTNSATGASQSAIDYGLILAGLSEEAQSLGLNDPLDIVRALSKDIADGLFDGMGADGTPISLNGSDMSAAAGTTDLSQAISTFSDNPDQNVSGGNVSSATITAIITPPPKNSYTISGKLSGLTGTVILQNNGVDDLTLNADGGFTFNTAIDSGSTYNVTVSSQPTDQTCKISNGSGTVDSSDITDITVSCTTNTYTIGGALSGLVSGSITLQNNNKDDLTLNTNGGFTFNTPIDKGSNYNISVSSQPAGQICTVTNGSGTVNTNNISSVSVGCTPAYTIGGTVSGLSGSVTLQNSNGDELTLNDNGSYSFANIIGTGSTYDVIVSAQPTGQTCTVSNGSGTMGGKNITIIDVSCTTNDPNTYTIGGTLTGLSGSVTLGYSGGNDLTLYADGSFTFTTPVNTGWTYNIYVINQPSGQKCTVANKSGTVGISNITDVAVSCVTNADTSANTSGTYTIGGTLSGLSSSVTLQNNKGDDLTLDVTKHTFTFKKPIDSGSPYDVTVSIQPSGQNCNVSKGSGTVANSNITDVAVSCTTSFSSPTNSTDSSKTSNTASTTSAYSIGGTLLGLSGSVTLQNNGMDNLTLNADGNFTFNTPINSGSPYNVTVSNQPIGQSCTVANGSGTVDSSDIAITVSCTTNSYYIYGTLSGLSGSVTLQNNGVDDLTLTGSGNFKFNTPITSGLPYNVTVSNEPSGQKCTVYNGTDTVAGNDISNVAVSCTTKTYSVGGMLSGLNGSVTLQNSNGDSLTLNANGSFTFTNAIDSGSSYNVIVSEQPMGQTCSVKYGSGTDVSDNVSNVDISCIDKATNTYTIGGKLSGLSGTVTLHNSNGDNLTLYADGDFTFATAIDSGATYDISVSDPPTGQDCTVSKASGTVDSSNISDVLVSCTTNKYTIGGKISGLSGSVTLQNSGGDDLTLYADGNFTFTTPIDSGLTYNVYVSNQPTDQKCTVKYGSGTVGGSNVTSIAISCATTSYYTIGGTLTGLSGSVTLQNNGVDDLTLNADGDFTFNTPIKSGSTYNVTVSNQPLGKKCTVDKVSGTGTVGTDNIISVSVSCSTVSTYTIGGQISGLNGSVTLQNSNSGDSLTLNINGSFEFNTPVNSGSNYNVTVSDQPTGQICSVTNGTGKVSSNVNSVDVACSTDNHYTVGGTITGMTGSGLSLKIQVNNGNSFQFTPEFNGAFTFSQLLTSGDYFSIGILTQPDKSYCNVMSYAGTVGSNNINTVSVTCVPRIFTVAGNGANGYSGDGDLATSAQLNFPHGVAVDAEGNIYIADTYNNVIRKVDTSGNISTIAGSSGYGSSTYSGDGGPATSALLYNPRGLAIDSAGNLYIADSLNNVIRKIDTSGIITTVAGNGKSYGDGGLATNAKLSNPDGIAVDSDGNLYIADTNHNVIRKVDNSGIISTIAGNHLSGYSGDGGPATDASLKAPEGVAVDKMGNVFIADSGNSSIRKVDINGNISTVAGTGSPSVWSCNCLGGSIVGPTSGPATSVTLKYPDGVAVDPAGNLYISDTYNALIRKVDASGNISTVVGDFNLYFNGDGKQATSGEVNLTYQITFDPIGNLYIADQQNHRIRHVTGIVPDVPTLTATAGNTQITLSWTASLGATSYSVYQGTSAGKEDTTTPVQTGISSTSTTISGLTPGTTYYFKVAAVNANGATISNERSVTP